MDFQKSSGSIPFLKAIAYTAFLISAFYRFKLAALSFSLNT